MGSSLYNKYPEGYNFRGKRVLNLGCGYAQYRTPNVVNLDAESNCNPDVQWNLEDTPLPFEDESFDWIIANHILEHVRNGWALFCDLSRICKPDGRIEVWVPGNGADSVRGYRDHVAQISGEWFAGTFGVYRNGGNAWADANLNRDGMRAKLIHSSSILENYWWLKWPKFWQKWCAKHLRNVVFEQSFIFRKVTAKEFAEAEKFYEERMNGVLPVREVPGANLLATNKVGGGLR